MSLQQFPIVITNAIKLEECLQTIEKGINFFVVISWIIDVHYWGSML